MLLTVGVPRLLSVLLPLQCVRLLRRLCHRPLLPLQVVVINDLKASVVLLLECPEPVFLFSLPLEECLLDDLLVTLVKDGRLLLIIETLEVVGLDSVRGQH